MTGSFCALFATYVTIWSLGIFDVIGDARYMATTASGAVVTAMFGVGWVLDRLGRTTALRAGVVGALCLLAGFSAYRLRGIGTGLAEESALMRDATRWLKSSGYAAEKIYYFNSIVPVELAADPYDPDRMDQL
jgi:GNAT superfamily N-acetyltransferase